MVLTMPEFQKEISVYVLWLKWLNFNIAINLKQRQQFEHQGSEYISSEYINDYFQAGKFTYWCFRGTYIKEIKKHPKSWQNIPTT